MKSKSICNDDDLRILLDKEEDSDEFRLSARHLETCAHCQSRLEELAAGEIEWNEAREMLVSAKDSEDGFAIDGTMRPTTQPRWQQRPTAWIDSMAKQLLSPPSHPEMLGRIGRYEVERLIGTGGMGIVFKAFDSELHRPVAVKVLAPYLAGSGAARQRFAREARAAAAVVHEHVVAIHNVETDGEAPFLVMQYVPGESLQNRLDRDGPLDVREILRIGMQTAAGLAAAHAQGLVHRDVKPSNILLEKGIERTLLTDFGLARASDDASLTHTGYHPGTPQYMSPEQARGDAVDARSDLFSLGSVLYTMSTGRPPFRADTSYGILRRITDTEPRSIREINPNVPDWLERFIKSLLSKSPDDRFQSAEQVAELLKQCLAHVQQPTTVELPNECCARVFSVQFSVLRKSITVPLPIVCGAVWRIFAGIRGRTFAAVSLVTFVLICLASVFAYRWSPSSNSALTNSSIGRNDKPQSDEGPISDLKTDWDSTSNAIHAFGQELPKFENRSSQVWGEPSPIEQE